MQLETAIAIAAGAGFACYLVYRWQEAAMAPPPYQEPVKSGECNQDCRQGRDCDCFQRSCDMNVQEFDTQLNPKAAWPFPTSTKP